MVDCLIILKIPPFFYFRTIPDGDVLIHAGDFTRCGHLQEVKEFNTWLGTLPHKHKIVIAGNHELSFDQVFRDKMEKSSAQNTNATESIEAPFSPRYEIKKYYFHSYFSI